MVFVIVFAVMSWKLRKIVRGVIRGYQLPVPDDSISMSTINTNPIIDMEEAFTTFTNPIEEAETDNTKPD